MHQTRWIWARDCDQTNPGVLYIKVKLVFILDAQHTCT